MIFNVCGFFGGVAVVGVGVSVRVWGDRACQSEGLTDRRAVGTGDRGHSGLHGLTWGPFMGLSNR